ncbi:MAG TPA: hemerythrin domain-containing protein [Micromonosporaceae bacterium]|nr:hemerythrin domain-containing protein [Micromonosporaceae bacterium]
MTSDVVTLIKNDHRVMETLFGMLKSAGSDRPALLSEVAARLSAHSWAEEEKVYPALVKAGEEQEVYHGVEEHHEATELLHRLLTIDPDSGEFDTALADFVAAVQHHVEEEESEILPDLAAMFDRAKLERLGQAFEERRLEVLRSHGIDDKAIGSGGAAVRMAQARQAGRADVEEMTRDELYEKAKQADIPGRSQMSKDELTKAVQNRE